jgi:hypothetical protein
MKKTIAVLLVTLFFPFTAHANPPEDIQITLQGQTLEIFVLHPVPEISHHFIKTVKVTVNGNEAVAQTFWQQSADGQRISYIIPGLNKGDQLSVWAACSVYGEMRKGITVDQG